MKRWVPHLVFATAVAAIAALLWGSLMILGRPLTPLENKLAEAERILYYRLDADTGATFRLSGTEDVVKVVAHAVQEGDVDPALWNDFGVRAQISSPAGELLWSAELFTSSRRSQSQWNGEIWLRENAFSLRSGVAISDDRLILMSLPVDVPVNSNLRLSRLGAVPEVAVRVYARDRRSASERRLARQALFASERDELIARTTFEPWILVPGWEQLQRLRYRFKRVAAIGTADVDFRTRAIWYTGYRAPLPSVQGSRGRGLLLSARQSLAIPTAGVDAVRLRIVSRLPAATSVDLRMVGVAAAEENQIIVPAGGSVDEMVRVPAATATLILESAAEEPLAVTVQDASASAPRELVPDRDVSRYYRVAARDPALSFSLPGAVSAAPARFLLSLRAIGLAADDWAVAEPPLTPALVELTFLDESGRLLERREHPVGRPLSTFDHIRVADERVAAATEALHLRLTAPRGARALSVRSLRGDVALRFYVFAEITGAAAPDSGEDQLRWRFRRREDSPWFEAWPRQRAALQRDGREVTLVGQVRAEWAGAAEGGGPAADEEVP